MLKSIYQNWFLFIVSFIAKPRVLSRKSLKTLTVDEEGEKGNKNNVSQRFFIKLENHDSSLGVRKKKCSHYKKRIRIFGTEKMMNRSQRKVMKIF